MAFGLRQQGTSSLVAGFSPGQAKNRQQKGGIYHSAEGRKTPAA
jgi:hypothetical protein